MTVKLYGAALSVSTQAVVVALREAGVPHEVVLVDVFKGEHKSAEYTENFHPFGQVPVMVDDDGFKVYESRAIAKYLLAKYAPESPLVPKDLKKNALFEQAFSIESSDFHPFATALLKEKLLKPLKGEETLEVVVAECTKKLEENLKVYDKILSKQKYLAGDELTLADLFHLPAGYLLSEKIGFEKLKDSPNLARWWADISSRPAWKQVREQVDTYTAKLKK